MNHRRYWAVLIVFLFTTAAFATQPSSGTISVNTTTPLTWQGTILGGASPDGENTCVQGVNCDTYTLTLAGTVEDWGNKAARVKINWSFPTTDYDIYIHKGTVTGPEADRSGDALTTSEDALIIPSQDGVGTFVVNIVYYAATSADQHRGTVDVVDSPFVKPGVADSGPEFRAYTPPAGVGVSAGEPTIGLLPNGKAMFIAGLETLRVSFHENDKSASAWENKSDLTTSIESFDPILFTDSRTGRTFVSQLLPTKISLMSWSDDGGETWHPSQGAGINSGVDHQTVGGGPFKPGILGRGPLTAYPNAVYYASQDIGVAQIALSRDGGTTFDVAVPMWNLLQCGGLHGHIKVAPDGTVYVPNKSCGSAQGFAVSEDNGLTWSIRTVPGSTSGATDPSVGIASDGTVYFGYANNDGKAFVAVTKDKGLTWQNVQDVGAAAGIQNTVFSAMTAGDSDRAAFFFLGSTTAGANGIATDRAFPGVWYPYVATTYDGGKTWALVNTTPNDPAQRGVVCTSGTTCPSGTRNLLDFNDLEIDPKGRPHAAFADGCVTAACIQGVDRSGAAGTPDGAVDGFDNDGAKLATIIRQTSGRTLYSAYDEPNAPSALDGGYYKPTVRLNWADNAANETSYVVERSTNDDQHFAPLATVGANATSYTDSTTSKKNAYYYRVRAVNANGTSSYSNVVRVYAK
jgi:BNR repeat-like domain